jgi:hypothetical protein
VSDISEGDIPELPEVEDEEEEMEEAPAMEMAADIIEPTTVTTNLRVTTTNGHDGGQETFPQSTALGTTTTTTVSTFLTARSAIAREDIEEISDEEAEWSDDVETAGYSDFEPMEITGGEAMENNMVRIFDIPEMGDPRPLAALCSPIETMFDRVSCGKVVVNRVVSEPGSTETAERTKESPSLPELLARLSSFSEEDNNRSSIDERWVDTVESLTVILQEELRLLLPAQPGVTAALVRVALIGLDCSLASAQPKPGYQIRHVKAGLRFLLEALGCDAAIFEALIGSGVQEQLLKLYQQRFMTMPTKLLVLRVMDRTLDRTCGIVRALGEPCSSSSPQERRPVYEQLLHLLQENNKTRIKFALMSTVNKFHLYEVLVKLAEVVADSTIDSLEETELLLRQLASAYTSLNSTMSHPTRFLPCSQHWDLDQSAMVESRRSYFALVDQVALVAGLVALVSRSSETVGSDLILTAIHDLLELWLGTEAGLLYLAAGGKATSDLVRVLLARASDSLDNSAINKSSTDDQLATTTSPARTMTASTVAGFKLATMMQAVQQLDTLTAAVRAAAERTDLESRQVLEAVQVLYGLTFTGHGKRAVVHVLTMGRHMDAILALTRHSTPDGQKDMKKSAVRGYANELLLLAVRSTDNVEFLARWEHSTLAF